MSNWFECKVKYQKVDENGKQKGVAENYMVDAVSFTDAEARITKELEQYAGLGEFVVVDEPDVLAKLATAKAHGASLVANAPLAIVVVADTSKSDVWVEDASIATTLIMLEAENQGLGACWVQMHLRGTEDGVSATENLRKLLNLKPEHEVLAVVAIGYKAEEKPARTDDDLKFEKVHHLTL